MPQPTSYPSPITKTNYIALVTEHNTVETTANAAVPASQKGTANGVASLGSDGKVPTAQLPASAAVSEATTTTKGIVQLAGDLAGTSALPRVADALLRSIDAVIFRDETGGTYPLRSTVTSDPLRRVRWVGSVDVAVGGGYALANDVQERRPV